MIVKCPHMYKGHITGSLQSTTYRSVSLFVLYFLVLVAIARKKYCIVLFSGTFVIAEYS